MIERAPYHTDLTDDEWSILASLVPTAKVGPSGGRPAKDRREVINGIRYVVRTGCAWRLMPHDLPNWGRCYFYFRKWKNDGTWQRIHDRLRGEVRVNAGRERQPSAAIIDSQSVKTTEKGGDMGTTRAKRSTVESGTCLST